MLNSHVRDNLVFIGGKTGVTVDDTVAGFTNTAYADLDALTTDPFASPAIVSVLTQTSAIVIISLSYVIQNTAGDCWFSYRISGATTVASSDNWAIRASSAASQSARTFVHHRTGMTVGTNTFEMQARVTANNANAGRPSIHVIPLTT